jgi:hypothetical protein
MIMDSIYYLTLKVATITKGNDYWSPKVAFLTHIWREIKLLLAKSAYFILHLASNNDGNGKTNNRKRG